MASTHSNVQLVEMSREVEEKWLQERKLVDTSYQNYTFTENNFEYGNFTIKYSLKRKNIPEDSGRNIFYAFLNVNANDSKRVVLKRKRCDESEDSFKAEVKISLLVSSRPHENILQFYKSLSVNDVGTGEVTTFLVMENCSLGACMKFIPPNSVRTERSAPYKYVQPVREAFVALTRMRRRNTPRRRTVSQVMRRSRDYKTYDGRDYFHYEEAKDLISGLLSALEELHERDIVHLDLKPENILLTRNENGELVPKLMDFGLSREVVKGEKSYIDGLGTPAFRGPERSAGGTFDPYKDDVYCVGLIYFSLCSGYLLLGHNGFTENIEEVANNATQLAHEITRDNWIDHALRGNEDDRLGAADIKRTFELSRRTLSDRNNLRI